MSEAKTTPQSSYTGPIVVDPLTRIEGHLRIEVEVENGRVKDARSCSTLFRGLETILKGRDPALHPAYLRRMHLHPRPGVHPRAGRRHAD